MTATQDVQVFKQEAGACHDDGSVMEPGWYWVRQRAGADSTLPPIPYGTPVGPFATSRRAAHDYVLTTEQERIQARYLAARIENEEPHSCPRPEIVREDIVRVIPRYRRDPSPEVDLEKKAAEREQARRRALELAAEAMLATLKSIDGRYKTGDVTMGDDLYRYLCATIAEAEGRSP